MLKLKLVIVVSFTVLLLALTGCRGMVAPPEATTLTVMTYNIYVGTEVAEDLLAIADPSFEFPRKVATRLSGKRGGSQTFRRRAAAIAKIRQGSLSRTSSGCRRVSLIRKQDSADSLVNPQPNSEDFARDFLAVLQGALEAADLRL